MNNPQNDHFRSHFANDRKIRNAKQNLTAGAPNYSAGGGCHAVRACASADMTVQILVVMGMAVTVPPVGTIGNDLEEDWNFDGKQD